MIEKRKQQKMQCSRIEIIDFFFVCWPPTDNITKNIYMYLVAMMKTHLKSHTRQRARTPEPVLVVVVVVLGVGDCWSHNHLDTIV